MDVTSVVKGVVTRALRLRSFKANPRWDRRPASTLRGSSTVWAAEAMFCY